MVGNGLKQQKQSGGREVEDEVRLFLLSRSRQNRKVFFDTNNRLLIGLWTKTLRGRNDSLFKDPVPGNILSFWSQFYYQIHLQTAQLFLTHVDTNRHIIKVWLVLIFSSSGASRNLESMHVLVTGGEYLIFWFTLPYYHIKIQAAFIVCGVKIRFPQIYFSK